MVAPLIGALRLAPIVSSDITYSWHCCTLYLSWHCRTVKLRSAYSRHPGHTAHCLREHSVSHRLPLRLPPTNQPKSPEFAFLEKCIRGAKYLNSDFSLSRENQVREVGAGNGSPQSFDARRWDNFVLPIPHLHGGHWTMDIQQEHKFSKSGLVCLTNKKLTSWFQFSIFNILLSTVYNWCTKGTKGLDQNHNWLSGGLHHKTLKYIDVTK